MAFPVPLALARTYDRPGPRYTSYPTAPHFTPSFDGDAYAAEIDRTNPPGAAGDLSLYVHLPFCRKLCFYCGCHMMVTQREDKVLGYLDYLEREVDLVAARLAPGRRVVQIHWGGGTPTYLPPDGIERLMGHLARRFSIAPGAEVSIEADPRGLTRAHLEAARRAGFNRISFGVQSFDPVVQAAIGRVQPEALVAQATAWARALGFEGVSYDLIYGLPHQSEEGFADTIRRVRALAPDRVSVFSYAHVPWMKRHQRVIDAATLPSPEAKLALFLSAAEALTADGAYRFIGMDHFARPDDPLARALDAGTMGRNFQGYTTHAGAELYGFGLSAISTLRDAYAQNEKDLRAYYAALDTGRLPTLRGYRLSADDHLRREVIGRLMSTFTLDVLAVEAHFGISFGEVFADALAELEPLARDGLVEVTPERIRVTPTGRFFVRNVAMPFDAYLGAPAADAAPRYSQTV